MEPKTVYRLSTHNNIVGIKEASGNKQRSKELLSLCSNNMQIFTGDDKTSIGDLLDGFSGNISVTANVVPKQMHMMCKYAMEGDSKKASELNKKIDVLHDVLFCESNPIPVKWCLNRMGLIKKGIRLPLTWLDEKYHEQLNRALLDSGAINE
jgi:4-hydroxy-tetrahydrodipicolinate synthase